MTKIVLIGFMGSGKSTLAKRLGERFSLPVFEMDEMVYEKTSCKNMAEVFAKGGEPLLRRTELEISGALAEKDELVISTGGGVVLNPNIMENLKKGCSPHCIFLKASFETLEKRITQDRDNIRPLFQDRERARALYDARQSLYERYADVVIAVDQLNVEQVVERVSEWMRERSRMVPDVRM